MVRCSTFFVHHLHLERSCIGDKEDKKKMTKIKTSASSDDYTIYTDYWTTCSIEKKTSITGSVIGYIYAILFSFSSVVFAWGIVFEWSIVLWISETRLRNHVKRIQHEIWHFYPCEWNLILNLSTESCVFDII